MKTYLEHFKLLELKKGKRKKERLEKSSVKVKMTYQDYDWVGMCNDGTLSKQTVAVLDKYIPQEQFDSGNELEEAALSLTCEQAFFFFFLLGRGKKDACNLRSGSIFVRG